MVENVDDASPSRATSRRSVLGGLAAGLGLVLIGPAEQATAAGASVSVTPSRGGLTSVATSRTSVVQVLTVLGATLKITSRPVQAGSTIALGFDRRLYRSAAPVLTTANGRILPCRRTRTAHDSTTGSETVTITLDEALVPGDTYTLSIGTRKLVRFPDDVVATPLPIKVTVTDKATGGSSRKQFDPDKSEHAVWGLRVGAGWQPVYWGDSFHSWMPELVTVASTGPADVPAGTVVSATLDARLFAGARFESLGGRTSSGDDAIRIDDVLRVLCVLPKPLPAQSRSSLRLMAEFTAPMTALTGLHPPTVTARGADAAVGQRITGLESATREDSAYDPTTRLTYGLDLVTPLRPR